MKLVIALCLAGLISIASARAQQAGSRIDEWIEYRAPANYESFIRDAEAYFPGPFNETAFRRDHSESDWRLLRDGRRIEAYTFAYRVDGLRITGALVRPSRSGRHPVLIWARGGVGAARLDAPQMVEMGWWAERGYIVIASNYRGAGGSDGQDEFAGADTRDLVALADIAAGLDDADRSRVFAVGFSRGGLMLYRAVADGLPVLAFATAGAPTDLADLADSRADLAELFQRMMPDFEAERAASFCGRSPVCWPERIAAPVLIAHGASDRAIPPDQSWRLAQTMEAAGRPARLMVYGGADHALNGSRRDFFEAAHAFFQSH